MDDQIRERIQELIDLRPVNDTFSLRELMGAEWPQRGVNALGIAFKAAVRANEFHRVIWHHAKTNHTQVYMRIG